MGGEVNILALDLGLRSTGLCGPTGCLSSLKPKTTNIERLAWFDDWLASYLSGVLVDVAVIEGYSFASANHRAERIGELGGVVRLRLHRAGVPVVEIAPKSIKRFATGKGNASKDAVLLAAARRFPDFDGDNNVADALWLYALANAKAGHPVVEVPKANLEALKAIDWPC